MGNITNGLKGLNNLPTDLSWASATGRLLIEGMASMGYAAVQSEARSNTQKVRFESLPNIEMGRRNPYVDPGFTIESANRVYLKRLKSTPVPGIFGTREDRTLYDGNGVTVKGRMASNGGMWLTVAGGTVEAQATAIAESMVKIGAMGSEVHAFIGSALKGALHNL